MPLFEKKNPTVEAVQYTGSNRDEIMEFIRGRNYSVSSYLGCLFLSDPEDNFLLEVLHPNDWILKEDSGKVSVCSNKTLLRDYKEK